MFSCLHQLLCKGPIPQMLTIFLPQFPGFPLNCVFVNIKPFKKFYLLFENYLKVSMMVTI